MLIVDERSRRVKMDRTEGHLSVPPSILMSAYERDHLFHVVTTESTACSPTPEPGFSNVEPLCNLVNRVTTHICAQDLLRSRRHALEIITARIHTFPLSLLTAATWSSRVAFYSRQPTPIAGS